MMFLGFGRRWRISIVRKTIFMKGIIAVLVATALAIILINNTRDVEIEIGYSVIFTEDEIVAAMALVEHEFDQRFTQRSSRLIGLSYEEDRSISLLNSVGWDINKYIVIMSFYSQWAYGLLGHGWTLRLYDSEWEIVNGPWPGRMGH